MSFPLYSVQQATSLTLLKVMLIRFAEFLALATSDGVNKSRLTRPGCCEIVFWKGCFNIAMMCQCDVIS